MTRQSVPGFETVRGVVHANEPMSRHTSWRVGGPARYFFIPADREDLARFLQSLATDTPILWVGLGSNLLVRDGGFDGAVIATHRGLSKIERYGEREVFVQAGVPCARLARFSNRHGLCGVEFMAGIPGTVGGALAMNAGAFGSETWQSVTQVELVNRRGEFTHPPVESFAVAYREVTVADDHWFTSARFTLSCGDPDIGQARIRSLLTERGSRQPVQRASAGSVFRNPPDDHAARLIEAAGLKGLRQGGAVVSSQHANFIINEGTASARDIETLIEMIRERVMDRLGVMLDPEVRFSGVNR